MISDSRIMERLAARLETATKLATISGLLAFAYGIAAGNPVPIVGSLVFLLPARLLPAVADWLRTKAAVEAARARSREAVAILPPQAPEPVTAIDWRDWPDVGAAWLQSLDEREFPSRTIH